MTFETMGRLSTAHTWRVRVRYEGGPLRGTECVESLTPPRYGMRFRGIWGWATIQSIRPTPIPPGHTRDEALAYRPCMRKLPQ